LVIGKAILCVNALFQVKSMLDKPSEVCIMDSDTWGPLRRLRRSEGGDARDVWPGEQG
jgi:hypothetical protein